MCRVARGPEPELRRLSWEDRLKAPNLNKAEGDMITI